MTLPPATIFSQSGQRATVLLHGMMLSPATWIYTDLLSHLNGTVAAYALPAHPTWELDQSSTRPLLRPESLVEELATAKE